MHNSPPYSIPTARRHETDCGEIIEWNFSIYPKNITPHKYDPAAALGSRGNESFKARLIRSRIKNATAASPGPPIDQV